MGCICTALSFDNCAADMKLIVEDIMEHRCGLLVCGSDKLIGGFCGNVTVKILFWLTLAYLCMISSIASDINFILSAEAPLAQRYAYLVFFILSCPALILKILTEGTFIFTERVILKVMHDRSQQDHTHINYGLANHYYNKEDIKHLKKKFRPHCYVCCCFFWFSHIPHIIIQICNWQSIIWNIMIFKASIAIDVFLVFFIGKVLLLVYNVFKECGRFLDYCEFDD